MNSVFVRCCILIFCKIVFLLFYFFCLIPNVSSISSWIGLWLLYAIALHFTVNYFCSKRKQVFFFQFIDYQTHTQTLFENLFFLFQILYALTLNQFSYQSQILTHVYWVKLFSRVCKYIIDVGIIGEKCLKVVKYEWKHDKNGLSATSRWVKPNSCVFPWSSIIAICWKGNILFSGL